MSDFWQDIVKILVDKALLGSIALALGFFLSRRLEDYRAKRSQEVFVAGRQVDAIAKVLEIFTQQHHHLEGAVQVVRKALAARPNILSDEEMEPAFKFALAYDDFKIKLGSIAPLLTPSVLEAGSSYMDVYGRLKSVVTEEEGATLPSDDEISTAFNTLVFTCSMAIRELT